MRKSTSVTYPICLFFFVQMIGKQDKYLQLYAIIKITGISRPSGSLSLIPVSCSENTQRLNDIDFIRLYTLPFCACTVTGLAVDHEMHPQLGHVYHMWPALAKQGTSRKRHPTDLRFDIHPVQAIVASDNQLDQYFQFNLSRTCYWKKLIPLNHSA